MNFTFEYQGLSPIELSIPLNEFNQKLSIGKYILQNDFFEDGYRLVNLKNPQQNLLEIMMEITDSDYSKNNKSVEKIVIIGPLKEIKTWCKYTCKCEKAINWRKKILKLYHDKDNTNAEAEKILYKAKCNDNHYNCPERNVLIEKLNGVEMCVK